MTKINKKQLNEYLALSIDPEIKLIEDSKKSYKIMITGDKSKMAKSNFQQQVLEGLKNINSKLDNIENRLDILESLPTIQKELKSQNKR